MRGTSVWKMSTGPTTTTKMMRKTHMRAPRALYASVKTTPLSPSCCLALFACIRIKKRERGSFRPHPRSIFDHVERLIDILEQARVRPVETHNFRRYAIYYT